MGTNERGAVFTMLVQPPKKAFGFFKGPNSNEILRLPISDSWNQVGGKGKVLSVGDGITFCVPTHVQDQEVPTKGSRRAPFALLFARSSSQAFTSLLRE